MIVNALIIVDLQKDFLPGGALPVPGGDAIIPVVNRLQPCVDLVVATKDWHPINHGSFAANHPGRSIGEVIDLNGLAQILWPVHSVQNTAGAEFANGFEFSRVAQVFVKGTDPGIDSYSGFFDNGHRKATGLGDFLKARQVSEVFVVGLATDYCVKLTALDARQLGFATSLLEDACRGVNLQSGDVERALADMRKAGVRIIQSADLLTY
jgi:nicotinamidase/pyrazinamidase